MADKADSVMSMEDSRTAKDLSRRREKKQRETLGEEQRPQTLKFQAAVVWFVVWLAVQGPKQAVN